MIFTKILFFLVFTFCNCKSSRLYDILSRQAKDIKTKMPPKEEYQKILYSLSITKTGIFQGIIPLDDVSIIHTKHSFPKAFAKFLKMLVLTEDFEESGMMEYNFTQRLDKLTYFEAVGVAYKVEDKLYIAATQAQTLAIPIPIKDGVVVEECKKKVFFKKCKKLYIEVIQGFSKEQLDVMEQALRAYGYNEISRTIELNKGLDFQIPD